MTTGLTTGGDQNAQLGDESNANGSSINGGVLAGVIIGMLVLALVLYVTRYIYNHPPSKGT